ncbi:ribonuclease HI [Candidatus Peregrinibacteria bacterium]|nr:ribonuclease HI [Candidatus Peregrinibacteria bacterium]
MLSIIIYTDGSCLGNPGPGGWAFLAMRDQKIFTEISGKSYHTTNNRMEMIALLEALNFCAENFSSEKIEINSDSNLLIQTLNEGWKRKANLDLWKKIDSVKLKVDAKFFWVKGHADDKYNHRCDELANNEASKAQKEIKKNPKLADQAKVEFEKTQLTKKPDQKNSDQVSLF